MKCLFKYKSIQSTRLYITQENSLSPNMTLHELRNAFRGKVGLSKCYARGKGERHRARGVTNKLGQIVFFYSICDRIESIESVSLGKSKLIKKRWLESWNESKRNKSKRIIGHTKSNNAEYRRIKMNEWFGLDRKIQFKTKNYYYFLFVNVQ